MMKRKLLVMAFAVVAAAAAIGVSAGRADAQSGVIANPGGGYSAVQGQAIQFSGAGSIGTALGYFWNFGDGTTATGVAPVKAYGYPGIYTVTLTVTDVYGSSSARATTATIGSAVSVGCFVNAAGMAVCNYGVGNVVVGVNPVFAPVYGPIQVNTLAPCSIQGNVCVTAVGGVAGVVTRPVVTPFVTNVYPTGCVPVLVLGTWVCR
jgi:PKD repeat protein